ncbi:hypothetical protein B0H17DRAFT_547466 [Mycena rosella]|uniref:GRF-type domain-containing protein n=1 Tax=Mycena rosella TaxID=1033263 RepID=A0AAD7DL95_MYCRO|nr:hypothetical protein B0H17DRAFT_547466 [Mycena rosella]
MSMARKRAADQLQEENTEPPAQRRKLAPTPAASEPRSVLAHSAEVEPASQSESKSDSDESGSEDGQEQDCDSERVADGDSDSSEESEEHGEDYEDEIGEVSEAAEGHDGSEKPAEPIFYCNCQQPAQIFTAGENAKPRNHGRQFVKCAMGRCKFWTWCDTVEDRQQAFNDAEDAYLESQQDHEDGDDGSEKSAADDNDLWARYGEDYDDGIGDAGQYDVDN